MPTIIPMNKEENLMLKISEFAQLAQTTRRTLILYDNNDLFKPDLVNSEGYRFYNYEQINELNLILTLKKLGLSIDEIKNIKNDPELSSNDFLLKLKTQVNDQISDLLKVNTFLDRKLIQLNTTEEITLYQPYEHLNKESFYWQSNNLDDCSPQQIAKTFSEFHRHLDQLMGINGNYSGFIIDIAARNPEMIENSTFKLIKEATVPINDNFITTVSRPAGKYLAVNISSHSTNSCTNLKKGLQLLKDFIAEHDLHVENKLWHINLGRNPRNPEDDATIIRLEFQVK